MISIDSSVLTAWYNAKSGVASATTSSASQTTTPAAPNYAATAPTTSALTQAVINGGNFIDPNSVRLGASSASPTETADYKNLFALYQGLTALAGVAQKAAASTATADQQANLQTTFARGLSQVQSFLGGQPFKTLTVADGKVETFAETADGVSATSSTYTTATLFSGAASTPVPAFQGDVQFGATVKTASGAVKTLAFNLDDLGSTPRTISNVVSYLNDQLEAAGVATRFSDVLTPAKPETIQAGGQTITIGQGEDSYALKLTSGPGEGVTFAAPATAPAVYIAQSSGTTAATASFNASTGNKAGATADATEQLLKLGSTSNAGGSSKIFNDTLSSNVTAVRATATGSDGSLYVLADLAGASPDGQAIQGASDVSLLKYDSTGHLLYSRTLGASSAAAGYALTLSPDGSQVAVAGSVTGGLTGTTTSLTKPLASTVIAGSAPKPDGFVAVYSTGLGDEQWSQTVGASGPDSVTGVAFGSAGTVYVTGNTGSTLPGTVSAGGQDGFVQAFTPKTTTSLSGLTSTIVSSDGATQFGTSGIDRSTGVVATADGGVIVASVESGHAILRRYDGPLTANAQPSSVRDLGSLDGGALAGISLAADGSIIVAGSTSNGALAVGAVTAAHAAGQQAFVAKLSPDLSASATDRLTYLDTGPGDASASALTVSGGQVYVTGEVAGAPSAISEGSLTETGYAIAVDATSGAVGWSTTFAGTDGQAAPSAIAVDASGSSVLDQLGLPRGTINGPVTQSLVSATSVRPGDQFAVRTGTGTPQQITVEAGDTLATLAAKVTSALGFGGTASVVVGLNGQSQLEITPTVSQSVEIEGGPTGSNALTALGLSPGLVTTKAIPTASATAKSNTAKPYALNLGTSLDVSSTAGAQSAQAVLTAALATVKQAYSDLSSPLKSTTTATSESGSVPAYITAQIADYQLALSRLTAASASDSSSTDSSSALLALF